jgi:hypothetical protein
MGVLGNLLGKAAERTGRKLGAMGGRGLHSLIGGGGSARGFAKTGAEVGGSLGDRLGGLLRKIPFKRGGVVRRRRVKRTMMRRRR